MNKTFIIAEAGVNHNGSLALAKKLINAAVSADADAVKFQTFKSEKVISQYAPKAEYQEKSTGSNESQLEMVKKLELSQQEHYELVEHCRIKGIQFLSTPFDTDSLNFLCRDLNVPIIKIPSGEITNAPFLLAIARTGKPVIMSTGMSTLGEIEEALGVLAFGYLFTNEYPSPAKFKQAYLSVEGQAILKDKVSLLHCTTEYPAPFTETNLKSMYTLQTAFNLPVGFSDHSVGISLPIAAVAMGATIIEKHFTLDKNLPGPDHAASLEPSELVSMVKAIREVEAALGNSVKLPAASEVKNIAIARKSLVAARHIKMNEIITEDMLDIKRPGSGISPMHYWAILGSKAKRDYCIDEAID